MVYSITLKISLLLTLAGSALAYDQKPKIEDPETVIHKFDRVAFSGLNLAIRGLNDLSVTKRLKETEKVNFEGYGKYNLSSHTSESGLLVKLKW